MTGKVLIMTHYVHPYRRALCGFTGNAWVESNHDQRQVHDVIETIIASSECTN